MTQRTHRILLTAAALVGFTFAAAPAGAAIIDLTASLDCAQANAGAGTCGGGGSGTGSATLTFDDGTNELTWSLSYSGLSGTVTAAHFHFGAPGVNGPVRVGIGTANPSNSSATLTAGQASELLAGDWYINVHSTTFGGGEIRGQVLVPEPGVLALTVPLLVGWAVRRRG